MDTTHTVSCWGDAACITPAKQLIHMHPAMLFKDAPHHTTILICYFNSLKCLLRRTRKYVFACAIHMDSNEDFSIS